MKKIIDFKGILLVLLHCTVLACSSGSEGDNPDPEPAAVPPGNFSLLLPAQNAICVDGAFSWQVSPNANTYTLEVFNAEGTVLVSQNTVNTQLTVADLPNSQAISWRVVAKNEDGEKVSATWAASTPGEAIVNYVPTVLSAVFSEPNDTMTIAIHDQEGEQVYLSVNVSVKGDFTDGVTIVEEQLVAHDAITTIDQVGLVKGQKSLYRIVLRDASDNVSVSFVLYDED